MIRDFDLRALKNCWRNNFSSFLLHTLFRRIFFGRFSSFFFCYCLVGCVYVVWLCFEQNCNTMKKFIHEIFIQFTNTEQTKRKKNALILCCFHFIFQKIRCKELGSLIGARVFLYIVTTHKIYFFRSITSKHALTHCTWNTVARLVFNFGLLFNWHIHYKNISAQFLSEYLNCFDFWINQSIYTCFLCCALNMSKMFQFVFIV